ncbi:MAG TPA: hypothetical protein VKT70_14380, partial [Stellaceae bacterium]|nr:hypothetical protein [Stellaceae bacterium]
MERELQPVSSFLEDVLLADCEKFALGVWVLASHVRIQPKPEPERRRIKGAAMGSLGFSSCFKSS